MARIVVIGGGLAGLSAAYRLSRARHRVLVVEAGARFGGQLQTECTDGYVIEHGAEGFVARSEAVPRLAHQLGIGGDLIGQSLTRSLGYHAGELRELAAGEAATLLGFQVPPDDVGAGIRSFRRGMGSLIDALRSNLASDVEMRAGFRVRHIERRSRDYEIRADEGVSVLAERIVIATSSRAAGELLSPVVGDAALEPGRARALSSVTVSLAFARDAIPHPLDATGFVIATDDQWHGARACTFTSSKFAERAPAGCVSLRVFIRPDPQEQKTLTDATYAARALEVVTRVVGAEAAPLRSWVSRWPDALPVFDAQRKEAVEGLETALKGSRIALAGSAFHGAGIDAALRSAATVEERL
jgi:protoporphyrinogen/coproporphyrinogen III oxidase